LTFDGRRVPLDELRHTLADHELLLILDNCEHLPIAPFVQELLASAPRLRILTTSRAMLDVAGEVLDTGELDRAAETYCAAVGVFEAGGHRARVIEAIAGLAAAALASHDLAQAQAHAETIVEYLEHGTLTIDNTEEPFRVELICYQVLLALGDPRAPGVLAAAHQRVQERAAKISDVRLQRSFLENVPYHRAIVAAWAAR
jgi:hypothetical protein